MFRTVLLQRVRAAHARQRFMNAYVANVPGPPNPLYFARAALIEVFPIVPITANISIGVGAALICRPVQHHGHPRTISARTSTRYSLLAWRSLRGLEHSVTPTAP